MAALSAARRRGARQCEERRRHRLVRRSWALVIGGGALALISIGAGAAAVGASAAALSWHVSGGISWRHRGVMARRQCALSSALSALSARIIIIGAAAHRASTRSRHRRHRIAAASRHRGGARRRRRNRRLKRGSSIGGNRHRVGLA